MSQQNFHKLTKTLSLIPIPLIWTTNVNKPPEGESKRQDILKTDANTLNCLYWVMICTTVLNYNCFEPYHSALYPSSLWRCKKLATNPDLWDRYHGQEMTDLVFDENGVNDLVFNENGVTCIMTWCLMKTEWRVTGEKKSEITNYILNYMYTHKSVFRNRSVSWLRGSSRDLSGLRILPAWLNESCVF